MEVAEPVADWNLPDDEAQYVRYSPWSNAWIRGVAWFFLITGFLAFGFLSRMIENDVSHFVAVTEALALVVISQTVLIYLYRKMSGFVDIGSGYRRLRSKVPEEATLPVRISIRRHGVLTGCDEGYMWQADGTWYFKGLQTAFRINQQDVVPIEAWPKRIKPDPEHDKPPKTLPLKSKHGKLELKVEVINSHEDFTKRKQARAFYREMFDWLTERPRGSIESLMPPLTVHPSLVRTGKSRIEGVIAGLVMVGINGAVLMRLPREDVPSTDAGSFNIIIALILIALLVSGFRLSWLEQRDQTVRRSLQDQNSSKLG